MPQGLHRAFDLSLFWDYRVILLNGFAVNVLVFVIGLSSGDIWNGSGQVQHRYRTGSLSVPSRLSEIITGVVGLDDRPAARPQFRRRSAFGG